MKCNNCGFEAGEVFEFCPNCGVPVQKAEAVSLNPAADLVLASLKDKLFLVICILMSVGTVLSLISGNLPVIEILITIFLWLTYAKSLKNIADENHLRCVSGSVYANYVVVNVVAIIIIVCGAIFAALLGTFSNTSEIINSLAVEYGEIIPELQNLPETILGVLGVIIGFVLIIIGVACLLFNILGMRKIHRFAKSVYQSIITQTPEFEYVRAARNWLIFFGVCGAISALSSLTTEIIAALTSLCSASSMIIAVILINKYFIENEKY
ncbi:MAG: zinc ribbon domain-containing protein [Ruminococcaceae bacterium]|nr:zinc ribbon domain-containing protein [Oscillospiraceae bacterium]